jgi:hypothetical protein
MSMQEVAPGVYRLRLGEPEKASPVGMREVPILSEGYSALPKAGGSGRVPPRAGSSWSCPSAKRSTSSASACN